MKARPNIFEVIESRNASLFLEVLDMAFKAAARQASFESHALGLDVADGRAEEDRRPKAIKPND